MVRNRNYDNHFVRRQSRGSPKIASSTLQRFVSQIWSQHFFAGSARSGQNSVLHTWSPEKRSKTTAKQVFKLDAKHIRRFWDFQTATVIVQSPTKFTSKKSPLSAWGCQSCVAMPRQRSKLPQQILKFAINGRREAVILMVEVGARKRHQDLVDIGLSPTMATPGWGLTALGRAS